MTDLPTLADRDCIGIVIVDHGSHRAESNRRHEDFVAEWKLRSGYTIVEAAHMELAEPSIGTAFDACVVAGATLLVVAPSSDSDKISAPPRRKPRLFVRHRV